MASLGEDSSDDEVFMGKMTLKEVKKNIFLNFRHNRNSNIISQSQKSDRGSFKIIETHSQPDLRSTNVKNTPPQSTQDSKNSDDSFTQIENLVTKLCLTSEKVDLKTTLDVDDCIQYNDPGQASNQIVIKIEKPQDDMQIDLTSINDNINTDKKMQNLLPGNILTKENLSSLSPRKSPKKKIATPKTKPKKILKTSPKFFTPIKSPKQEADIFLTPSSNMLDVKTSIFKTPNSVLSKPSASSLKTSPCKSTMYKNIKSPIAKYIKGSIQAPLVTNVCPKKRLPATGSLIPKLVKPQIKQDKENAILPTTAYKTAKQKVVQLPDEEKPKNQVAKKLLSTLPRPPVILKHETRKFNTDRKPLCQLAEDSIADLSCAQADLSVCTLVKPKH